MAEDFDGLQHLISDTPSSQTDVGGIDASVSGNSYWRNIATTTTVTAFNTNSEGLTALDTLLNDTTFGRQGPPIVTSPAGAPTRRRDFDSTERALASPFTGILDHPVP